MLVIGLTGGIGTGKSEVGRILRNLGATVVEADRVGHEAYRRDSPVWRDVVDTFGAEILQATGEIDRKRLGAIIFSDPEARAKLNSIMHPKMAETIGKRIGGLRQQGAQVVVVEAALLLEAGWDTLVDEIWVTRSPAESVVERLSQTKGLSEKQIQDRMRSQAPYEHTARHAHILVDNFGTIDDLRQAVENLWADRVEGKVR